ncbi:MAG: pentapeptide repeat-containing protein [Myxococcales bacterium]|nr:pentapeptide repeat-containing protein [Myxococcales bacterium]
MLVASTASAASAGPEGSDERERLELAKLREEVRQLELDNERSASVLLRLLDWAPFLTALVAIAGGGITIWRQIDEAGRRQAKEIEQRREELLAQFQGTFASAAKSLGDTSPGVQVGAAASLMTLLKPRYREFSEDVFLLLAASLKVHREGPLADLLVRALEKATPLALDEIRARAQRARAEGREAPTTAIDLARTYLARVDLSGVDGSGVEVDVAFADLGGASLAGAKLRRLRAMGATMKKAHLSRADLQEAGLNEIVAEDAVFHETNLVSAKLKGAKLSRAGFQRARLQEAHFEGAQLVGARFEGADLKNAYFAGATLDAAAIRSLSRANHWETAHFDEEVRRALEEAAKQK